MNIASRIASCGVIPVVSAPDSGSALRVCKALHEAGLPVLEITFRTEAAVDAISAVRAAFPDAIVGAGTILTIDEARSAATAGASFGVAPGFNRGVVEAARDARLPFFPGVSTPSEIESALDCGCRILKLFPAEVLGGVEYLRAVAAPYAHRSVQFIPTGGISEDMLGAYLSMSAVIAVGGTWIAPADAVRRADWDSIENRAAAAVSIVRSIRSGKVPE